MFFWRGLVIHIVSLQEDCHHHRRLAAAAAAAAAATPPPAATATITATATSSGVVDLRVSGCLIEGFRFFGLDKIYKFLQNS